MSRALQVPWKPTYQIHKRQAPTVGEEPTAGVPSPSKYKDPEKDEYS